MQGVYILQGIKNLKYYIGSTDNLERRLKEHFKGLVHTTKRFLPVKLVFFQQYDDIKVARRIEYKIKKLKRKDIIERIIKEKIITMGL